MTAANVLKAASRTKKSTDLALLIEHKQEELVDLILSADIDDFARISLYLRQYHTLGDFLEHISELAVEAQQNG